MKLHLKKKWTASKLKPSCCLYSSVSKGVKQKTLGGGGGGF